MDELVNKLAELQAERKTFEDAVNSDQEVVDITDGIATLEAQIEAARKTLVFMCAEYDTRISEIDDEIKHVSAQIIDAWSGEKKTIQFDAGTLKFRTTQSLVVENETLVLTELLDHTSVEDVATNYITGFNKTAVKKYMGVLSLPMDAAHIDPKTTVKLEVV